VSLIVPMLNEEQYVGDFVRDIASQDFHGTIELIVADGGSTDRSVAVLRTAAEQAGLKLTLLENPSRWVSHALNACLDHASGDLIVRLDCHASYPPDYVRRLADAADETGAENVGGIVVADGTTAGERATACAMSSAFGGIGWSRHDQSRTRVDVDTVTYGAFRPRAFELAGGFDTSLVRNQDDEFNLRLRRAGGRIVLDPSIAVRYRPRATLRGVWRQYVEYGWWKIAVMRKHRRVVSARSLAPIGLVASLAGLLAATPVAPVAAFVAAGELTAWAGAATWFALQAVRRLDEPLALVPRVVARFAAFHFGYGIGMVRGVVSR
jgi:succinoglycan biosynthesis protein ExoA